MGIPAFYVGLKRSMTTKFTIGFMVRILFYLLMFFIIINWNQNVSAQIVVLDSFNPSETRSICGIGFDWETGNIWIYGCRGDSLYGGSTGNHKNNRVQNGRFVVQSSSR